LFSLNKKKWAVVQVWTKLLIIDNSQSKTRRALLIKSKAKLMSKHKL